MKTTRQLLSLSLLAGSAFAASNDFLRLNDVEVESKNIAGTKTLSVELKAAAPVPKDRKSGAFGYAALSDGGNNVLVLVTHLPIDDSSFERVPSGFHTHVLDLKPPTQACAGATFEVDVAASKANPRFDADYRWSVEGAEVDIEHVPVGDLGDSGVESVASFTLTPVIGADGKPSHLCVAVIEQR